jgi:hypothetical protein
MYRFVPQANRFLDWSFHNVAAHAHATALNGSLADSDPLFNDWDDLFPPGGHIAVHAYPRVRADAGCSGGIDISQASSRSRYPGSGCSRVSGNGVISGQIGVVHHVDRPVPVQNVRGPLQVRLIDRANQQRVTFLDTPYVKTHVIIIDLATQQFSLHAAIAAVQYALIIHHDTGVSQFGHHGIYYAAFPEHGNDRVLTHETFSSDLFKLRHAADEAALKLRRLPRPLVGTNGNCNSL